MKLFIFITSYIRYTYFPFFLYRTFVVTMMKNKYFELSFKHTNTNQKVTKSGSKHLILYSGFRLSGTPVNQNHCLSIWDKYRRTETKARIQCDFNSLVWNIPPFYCDSLLSYSLRLQMERNLRSSDADLKYSYGLNVGEGNVNERERDPTVGIVLKLLKRDQVDTLEPWHKNASDVGA